jgi:hypothetical protein
MINHEIHEEIVGWALLESTAFVYGKYAATEKTNARMSKMDREPITLLL